MYPRYVIFAKSLFSGDELFLFFFFSAIFKFVPDVNKTVGETFIYTIG